MKNRWGGTYLFFQQYGLVPKLAKLAPPAINVAETLLGKQLTKAAHIRRCKLEVRV